MGYNEELEKMKAEKKDLFVKECQYCGCTESVLCINSMAQQVQSTVTAKTSNIAYSVCANCGSILRSFVDIEKLNKQ